MHIALLEDEIELAQEIHLLLTDAGHTVEHFLDGRVMMRTLLKGAFDLFVLDWDVAGYSGIEMTGHLRNNLRLTTPIMLLTCSNSEEQTLQALEAGADDYCPKPVLTQVFMARVTALNRSNTLSFDKALGGELLPGYVFDHVKHIVWVYGEPMVLTEKEYELSRLLFENPDRAISRRSIMMNVWGRDTDTHSRTLDVHISWIRRKLSIGANSDHIRLLVMHGYGYRLMRMTPTTAGDA